MLSSGVNIKNRETTPDTRGEIVAHKQETAHPGVRGTRPATKVRHRLMSGHKNLGYVNSDLIFLAGKPIVVLVWDEGPFGDYPAVTVALDERYLHQINWPEARYLYEHAIEDPQGASSRSNTESDRRMTEQLSDPIPNDVRQAFLEVIRLFKNWTFGGSEPLVSFRKLRRISISGVCELVLSYRNEPLPENLDSLLRNLIDGTRTHLKVGLDEDPSYATAAQCLLKMIDVSRGRAAAA